MAAVSAAVHRAPEPDELVECGAGRSDPPWPVSMPLRSGEGVADRYGTPSAKLDRPDRDPRPGQGENGERRCPAAADPPALLGVNV